MLVLKLVKFEINFELEGKEFHKREATIEKARSQ